MVFNKKIKSFEAVLNKYNLRYESEDLIIQTQFIFTEYARLDLMFNINETPYKSSEAAIRESIIFPVLREAWKHYADIFTLWVERPINFNDELSGVPDYIISKKSPRGKIFFENPYIAVVEAKKDDFTGGWAQCSLEMCAIQKINGDENISVFGIVTNGDTWEFAVLKKDVFTLYKGSFSLLDFDKVLNAICTLFEMSKSQFVSI
jgi:hypothetical protein